MLTKFLDPKNDIAFKRIFGTEKNKDILIHFIIDQLTDNIDKWMYFFKLAEDTSPEDLAKIIANDPIIAKAYQQLDRTYWNQIELLTYEQAEKRINDLHAVMMQKLDEGIAKGIVKGKEEGLTEGIVKGKEEGLTEGIVKGKEEGLAEGIEKERKKIVAAMHSKGIDAEAIATLMGLSLAEVNLLLSNVSLA